MTRTAALYVRLSKDRNGDELGVTRQRDDALALAESLGWRVVAIHSDNDLTAYSGKPRPGFEALCADLEAGHADTVIAWHTDRLYRHPRDLERFVELCERRKVLVRTVRAGELDLSTDAGRMIARILGAVARQEVERSTDRIRAQKRQAAADGRYRGGPRPFGFEADGVTVRTDEAAEVRGMVEGIVSGGNLSAIVRGLNERGVRSSSGNPFDIRTVRRIVLRARNIGRIEMAYVDDEGKRRTRLAGQAQWPAIVDAALWEQACAILTDPDRRTNDTSGEPRWLLSGIALCGVCLEGGTEQPVAVASGRRSGELVRVYRCPVGGHMTKGVTQADAFVGEVMARWLARPEAATVLASDPQVDPVAVLAEVEKLKERMDQAQALFDDGLRDFEQHRASLARMRAREAELLASIGTGGDAGPLTFDMLTRGWNALTVRERRGVVRAFARVVLEKSARGRPAGWAPGQPYFRPESVRVELGRAAVPSVRP